MNSNQPIAFISHAGEDKATFVIPFAEKLLVVKDLGGNVSILDVSASGKRAARSI
jgi:hypothetical protein